MRISDWSSDVCSSDLLHRLVEICRPFLPESLALDGDPPGPVPRQAGDGAQHRRLAGAGFADQAEALAAAHRQGQRSEEHTSELQSLMRISYAVFCLQKKKIQQIYRNSYKQPQKL